MALETQSTERSLEIALSDLEIAIDCLKQPTGLIGYSNVLSYVASLGVQTFSSEVLDARSWVRIGSGAYSTTYKAHLKSKHNSLVAVKQPNGSFSRADVNVEARLQHKGLGSIIQELRVLAHEGMRKHPNLPHVLGVFFQEEKSGGVRPCVVFELASSVLDEYFHNLNGDKLFVNDVEKLATDIAAGVAALHTHNIVHGDLKPNNILLFIRQGAITATVADLGTSGQDSLTSSVIDGTIGYCPPEYHYKSQFREHVNRTSRDIYNYGLILWSIMTRCELKPFTYEIQFELQHEDDSVYSFLLEKIPREDIHPIFIELMRQCLKCNPTSRPTIFDILHKLEPNQTKSTLSNVISVVERGLLTDPDNPRVKVLSEMPLPTHLIAKLRQEYCNAPSESDAIRSAITLAGLYSGVIGIPIAAPWDTIAKIQWLAKAVELGSLAAVGGFISDQNALETIQKLGTFVLRLRRPIFISPKINLSAFRRQLKHFAEMDDVDASDLLRCFQDKRDPNSAQEKLEQQPRQSYQGKNDSNLQLEDAVHQRSIQSHVHKKIIGHEILQPRAEPMEENEDSFLEKEDAGTPSSEKDSDLLLDVLKGLTALNPGYTMDLQTVDSDAYDIVFSRLSPLSRSNFHNQLEPFIKFASESGLQFRGRAARHQMTTAIFNDSLEIVKYLALQYGVRPNDEWQGMNNIEQAALYRRSSVVKFFLQIGAEIRPTTDSKPSALHLVNSHDDPELAQILCEHLKKQGQLSKVLESKPTEGDIPAWTVLQTAMGSHAWRNAEVLLEYGADPNCPTLEGEKSLLELAVVPTSPAPPSSLLTLLLRKGAVVDGSCWRNRSLLGWAIGCSNVLAVRDLLLYDASVSLDDLEAARTVFEENQEMQDNNRLLSVFNEQGQVVVEGWHNMMTASQLVLDLVSIARDGQSLCSSRGPGRDWKQQLSTMVQAANQACKGKLWIAGSGKITYILEVLS